MSPVKFVVLSALTLFFASVLQEPVLAHIGPRVDLVEGFSLSFRPNTVGVDYSVGKFSVGMDLMSNYPIYSNSGKTYFYDPAIRASTVLFSAKNALIGLAGVAENITSISDWGDAFSVTRGYRTGIGLSSSFFYEFVTKGVPFRLFIDPIVMFEWTYRSKQIEILDDYSYEAGISLDRKLELFVSIPAISEFDPNITFINPNMPQSGGIPILNTSIIGIRSSF